MDFWPVETSTYRRECVLNKSKYVANIFSVSSGVILCVMISFVRLPLWCRVQCHHVRSTCSVYFSGLFTILILFCCRYWYTDEHNEHSIIET